MGRRLQVRGRRRRGDLADHVLFLCRAAKLPAPEREHLFHPARKWRFDCAWVAQKVAVEVHGGVFAHGRHVSGAGFTADCEKTRAAVMLGWRLLPFTGEDVRERPAMVIETIKDALGRVG